MTEFFDEWFGRHAGREVWREDIHDRAFIERSEELAWYVQYCIENKAPCWVSVQPFSARDQPQYLEKLFFDFDCKEDLGKAWKDAEAFSESLIRYYSITPFIAFSGNKGYHAYVFLNRTVYFQLWRTEFVKEVYESLQKKILKGLELPTLDQAVVGDIKRLSRVPFSVHEKTGKECVPVDLEGKPITIESLEPYREHGLETKLLEVICKELMAKRKWEEIRAERRRCFPVKYEGKVRPCIETALNLSLDTGAGHKMRLGIVSEYLYKGFSVDQTVDLFHSQVDFDEKKTRYYVEDAQKKGYKPFKCSTIKELGFCLGQSCSIFKKRRRKKLD